ncbi:MAG: ankyrin repeat domain-containing protein [Spirochaetales bacterium]|nr:ankyrin repeat domain-containing protein [Spirochaetales bacterium]
MARKILILLFLLISLAGTLYSAEKIRVACIFLPHQERYEAIAGEMENAAKEYISGIEEFELVDDEIVSRKFGEFDIDSKSDDRLKEIGLMNCIDRIYRFDIDEKDGKINIKVMNIVPLLNKTTGTSYNMKDEDDVWKNSKFILSFISPKRMRYVVDLADVTVKDLKTNKDVEIRGYLDKFMVIGIYDACLDSLYKTRSHLLLSKIQKTFPDNLTVIYGILKEGFFYGLYEGDEPAKNISDFLANNKLDIPVLEIDNLYKAKYGNYSDKGNYVINTYGNIVDVFYDFEDLDTIVNLLKKDLPKNAEEAKIPDSAIDATRRNDTESLVAAVKKGGASENNGYFSALHYAVMNGNLEIVKILMQNGANPNEKDFKKNTPLHYAFRDDRLAITKYLVDNGADILLRNEYKRTPYGLALFFGQEKTTDFLKQKLGKNILLASGEASYKEILDAGIKPGIGPEYKFPLSKQHSNACFGFALKHILKYKYNQDMDVSSVEKKIKKSTKKLWSAKNINDCTNLLKVRLDWHRSAAELFSYLMKGEPVLLQYQYYTSKKNWIGHYVAAYSFDDKGIWVAESIKNKRTRLKYSELFDESGKFIDYEYATVEK